MSPAKTTPKMTKAVARRALKDVDKEVRRHLETTIDLLTEKGMIDEGHLPSDWALEIQTRDGVKVRIEVGATKPTMTGSPAAAIIRDTHPTATVVKKVTEGQKSNIRGKRDHLGITEIVISKTTKYPMVQAGVYQLSDDAVTSLNDLDGSLPRETASAIISALTDAVSA